MTTEQYAVYHCTSCMLHDYWAVCCVSLHDELHATWLLSSMLCIIAWWTTCYMTTEQYAVYHCMMNFMLQVCWAVCCVSLHDELHATGLLSSITCITAWVACDMSAEQHSVWEAACWAVCCIVLMLSNTLYHNQCAACMLSWVLHEE